MNRQTPDNQGPVEDGLEPIVLGRTHLRVSLIAVFSGVIALATAFAGWLIALNNKIDTTASSIRTEQTTAHSGIHSEHAAAYENLRTLINTKADKAATQERYTATQAATQNAANTQRFESIEKSVDQRLNLILKMNDRTNDQLRELRQKNGK